MRINMKIALVGSSGGHLAHLYLLKKFWKNEDRFWVTFDKTDAQSILKDEVLLSPFTMLKNIFMNVLNQFLINLIKILK